MDGGSSSGSSATAVSSGLEWQCPSCTLLNRSHTFKCSVCGTPKGTSTRQAKCHSAAIEKQYVAESLSKLPKHYYNKSTVSTTTAATANATPTPPIPTSVVSTSSMVPSPSTTVATPTLSTPAQSTSSHAAVTNSKGKRKRTKSKMDKAVAPLSSSIVKGSKYPTLSNIDRTSGRSYSITVDSLTVVITEYNFLYPPSD